jgi:hypothetical protein
VALQEGGELRELFYLMFPFGTSSFEFEAQHCGLRRLDIGELFPDEAAQFRTDSIQPALPHIPSSVRDSPWCDMGREILKGNVRDGGRE